MFGNTLLFRPQSITTPAPICGIVWPIRKLKPKKKTKQEKPREPINHISSVDADKYDLVTHPTRGTLLRIFRTSLSTADYAARGVSVVTPIYAKTLRTLVAGARFGDGETRMGYTEDEFFETLAAIIDQLDD